jgi:uncharacterized Zn finger protein
MAYGWRPYVPVAKRRAKNANKLKKMQKKGMEVSPVNIEGRLIAKSFWGKAWCKHLESFSDFSNRLPRGRTYVRNGSVMHLDIKPGVINAIVGGTSLYDISIEIERLDEKMWDAIKRKSTGKIGSMLELLQGKLSDNIMAIVTDRKKGLLPLPSQISFDCSCPDWAVMCKHVAAVFYGVGNRLDQDPELLFTLRGVDPAELIDAEIDLSDSTGAKDGGEIASESLSDIFGIELDGNIEDAAAGKITADTQIEQIEFTGAMIKSTRKRLKLSAVDFAKKVGVSSTTIYNWEKSSGKLKLQTRCTENLTKIYNNQ